MWKHWECCNLCWSLCALLSAFGSNHSYVLTQISLIFGSFLQPSCSLFLRVMEISLHGFGGLVWIANLSLLCFGAFIFWLPQWVLVFLPKIYDDNFKDLYTTSAIIHLANYLKINLLAYFRYSILLLKCLYSWLCLVSIIFSSVPHGALQHPTIYKGNYLKE